MHSTIYLYTGPVNTGSTTNGRPQDSRLNLQSWKCLNDLHGPIPRPRGSSWGHGRSQSQLREYRSRAGQAEVGGTRSETELQEGRDGPEALRSGPTTGSCDTTRDAIITGTVKPVLSSHSIQDKKIDFLDW